MISISWSTSPSKPQKDDEDDPGGEESEYILSGKAPPEIEGQAMLNELREVNLGPDKKP